MTRQPAKQQKSSQIRVPFLDVAAAYKALEEELNSATQRVMSSGQYILGPEVAAFESEFAAYCEAKYCVGVGNGLDALYLTLRAWAPLSVEEQETQKQVPAPDLALEPRGAKAEPLARSAGAGLYALAGSGGAR